MRKSVVILTLLIFPLVSFTQNRQVDSLKTLVASEKNDTNKVNNLIALANKLVGIDPDATIRYATQAKKLAEELNFQVGLGYALKSIGMGHYFRAEFTDVLIYWQQSLKSFQSVDFKIGISNMLSNLGAVHFSQGDEIKAIEYYVESLKVAEEVNDKLRIATALQNIGAVYYNKEATRVQALQYYRRALPMCIELKDDEAIGTVAVNMGEIFLARNETDSALYYFNTSLEAYKRAQHVKEAYALMNIGKVYASMKDYSTAIQYQEEAFEKAQKVDAKLEMTQSLKGLAETYYSKKDFQSAIDTYIKAQYLGEEIGADIELKEVYEGLVRSYDVTGDYRNGYKYQELLASVKDRLYNAEMNKKIQLLTLNHEIDGLTKENEIKELNIQRQRIAIYAAGSTGVLLLLMAISIFSRYRYVRRTNKIIADEKERSDKLLLNILPVETAQELKEKGSATPKHYNKVSVLFTDFKGFTKIAEKLTPQELIAELNYCFFEFDKIIDKYHLEKIKTIGDAYMCAGGIPVANEDNPVQIVRAGLEIKAFMENLKVERESQGKDYWELRIGIHTGEVVAGVVGKNKFAYDIWGDAVNTASRMESSGIPGQVNISGTTYEHIKNHFECMHRGKIQAKNKGEIDMYIVEREA